MSPATLPPRYFPKRPMPQLPTWYQKQQLPPPEYDHDYDGEIIILRTIEGVVYRRSRPG
jgi:hypothetical protein